MNITETLGIDPHSILSLTEAAEATGLKRALIRTAVREGRIDAWTTPGGGKIYTTGAELDKLLVPVK